MDSTHDGRMGFAFLLAVISLVRTSAFLGRLQMAYDIAVRAEGDDSKLEALCYLLHSWGTRNTLKPSPYDEEFNLVFDDLLPTRVHQSSQTTTKP